MYLSKEISEGFLHRGSATKEKLETTLRLIRETGIKSLKNLTTENINTIITGLKEKVENGTLSTSAANSYISSINNIVRYSGNDELHLIKADDHGLSRNISEKDGINKENTREAAQAYKDWLNQKYEQTKDLRYEALKHTVSIQSVNLRLRKPANQTAE
ncbi:MAG: hypothetical protein M0016_01265 [Deltaproteobacteria bacterium]|jgi:hypothetical protein|nr:hypothetical protein [Deltaproteobacteria bacterium]MCL5880837.1 hypothetical protein [Deltaproteobacteria bacterium]MDA8303779.1 hypothetical protein [Deltaproteobacteria bacterium]